MDLSKYYGNYRAKVLKNKDSLFFGRVQVWIPDIMPEIDPHKDVPSNRDNGLWAYSANNPLGGRSGIEDEDQWGQGSCYIPKVGSYVWVFFEGGNINRPYYFGSLDIETSKVLPENQAGGEYQNKWTIFKSSAGRCIIISDDCDERIEITGKKRQLKKSIASPEGDIESVYNIDGNQTTILLEETEGNEKLLIRTHQGDFINIDITNRELYCQFESNISIKTNADFLVEAKNIHMTANTNMFLTAENEMNIAGIKNTYVSTTGSLNLSGRKEAMVKSLNTSIVGENLFLTGSETIHQSTKLNLLGGKINKGIIIKTKALAMDGAESGESGTANKPVLFGKRMTNATCAEQTKPDTTPIKGNDPIKSTEQNPSNNLFLPPAPLHDFSLIPGHISPDDIFERKQDW